MRRVSNFCWIFLSLCGLAQAQTQINPNTQIRGAVPANHGGTGLDTSALSGCVTLINGAWTVTIANCGSLTTVAGQTFGFSESGSQITVTAADGHSVDSLGEYYNTVPNAVSTASNSDFMRNGSGFALSQNKSLGFSSSSVGAGTQNQSLSFDTALSRASAGVWSVDTTTQGNAAGSIKLTSLLGGLNGGVLQLNPSDTSASTGAVYVGPYAAGTQGHTVLEGQDNAMVDVHNVATTASDHNTGINFSTGSGNAYVAVGSMYFDPSSTGAQEFKITANTTNSSAITVLDWTPSLGLQTSSLSTGQASAVGTVCTFTGYITLTVDGISRKLATCQ